MLLRTALLLTLFFLRFSGFSQTKAFDIQDTTKSIFVDFSFGYGVIGQNSLSTVPEVTNWFDRSKPTSSSFGISIKETGPKGIGWGLIGQYCYNSYEVEFKNNLFRQETKIFNFGIGINFSKKTPTLAFDFLPYLGFGSYQVQYTELNDSTKSKSAHEVPIIFGGEISARFSIYRNMYFVLQGNGQLGVPIGSSGNSSFWSYSGRAGISFSL